MLGAQVKGLRQSRRLLIGGFQRGLCSSASRRLQPIARAVGAVQVSPALKRWVGRTKIVAESRRDGAHFYCLPTKAEDPPK